MHFDKLWYTRVSSVCTILDKMNFSRTCKAACKGMKEVKKRERGKQNHVCLRVLINVVILYLLCLYRCNNLRDCRAIFSLKFCCWCYTEITSAIKGIWERRREFSPLYHALIILPWQEFRANKIQSERPQRIIMLYVLLLSYAMLQALFGIQRVIFSCGVWAGKQTRLKLPHLANGSQTVSVNKRK